MPSLRQILIGSSPILVVDTASARTQVGLVHSDGRSAWASEMGEAGVSLFSALEALDIDFKSVGAVAYCEGPGSILGIRTAAAAIRAWNVLRRCPVFAYLSLAVAAQGLHSPETTLIADARRGLWHAVGPDGILVQSPAVNLPSELVALEGFRNWDPFPPGTRIAPYDLAQLFADPYVAEADLLREVDQPDAWVPFAPSYTTWVPKIHRGIAPS